MVKVAVILSGCGYLDGSEIHESVLCLLALAQAGHEYRCFAPDRNQTKVMNHLNNEQEEEARNVLKESARIARGNVEALTKLDPADHDAILLPGGFGAALNLSTYATDGENCDVDADLRSALLAFHKAGKPIGATCISPAVLARVFKGVAVLNLTLGSSDDTVAQLEQMGMKGNAVGAREMVADEENKVYTTPCYMEPADLAGMFEGVRKVVAKLDVGLKV